MYRCLLIDTFLHIYVCPGHIYKLTTRGRKSFELSFCELTAVTSKDVSPYCKGKKSYLMTEFTGNCHKQGRLHCTCSLITHCRFIESSLTDQLSVWLSDWLTGWLAGWLAGWESCQDLAEILRDHARWAKTLQNSSIILARFKSVILWDLMKDYKMFMWDLTRSSKIPPDHARSRKNTQDLDMV